MGDLSVDLQRELVSALGRDLSLQQCNSAYYKLPVVPKALFRGPRGALFYINQRGKKVYLNAPQKDRYANARLPGVVQRPGPYPLAAVEIPDSVFSRVDRQLLVARRL